MRTRRFWRKRNMISEMMVPFSVLWFLWMRLREMRAKPKKLSVPVICIGNITAGGAGKTPVAMTIAKLLLERGHKPAFISRGYGGRLKGPEKVEPGKHTAKDVGDEPLLLAAIAPCYIARTRVQAADIAIMGGATVLIADDGMQNHSFVKDLTLAVVDGFYGFGNRLVLPAGPLRDRPDLALKSADAVVMIGRPSSPKVTEIINAAAKPILSAELQPTTLPDQQQPYIAFAGIGVPDKFFHTLKTIGVFVKKSVPFADHHPYTPGDMKKLLALAEKHFAKLITTEKDLVRVPQEFRAQVSTLPVQLVFDDPDALRVLVEKHLA